MFLSGTQRALSWAFTKRLHTWNTRTWTRPVCPVREPPYIYLSSKGMSSCYVSSEWSFSFGSGVQQKPFLKAPTGVLYCNLNDRITPVFSVPSPAHSPNQTRAAHTVERQTYSEETGHREPPTTGPLMVHAGLNSALLAELSCGQCKTASIGIDE